VWMYGRGAVSEAGDTGHGDEGEGEEEDGSGDVGKLTVAEVFCDELDGEKDEGGVGDSSELDARETRSSPGQSQSSRADGKGAEKGEMVRAGPDVEGGECNGGMDEKSGGGGDGESCDAEMQDLMQPRRAGWMGHEGITGDGGEESDVDGPRGRGRE
jgi:hypothetical protein